MRINISLSKILHGKFGITVSGDASGIRLIQAGNKTVAFLSPAILSALYPHHLGHLNYICNICGQHAGLNLPALHREIVSCLSCGSTVRFRAIIHILSVELFGESVPIPDFPERKDIHGIGMSDWLGYAQKLADKLDYVNTFFDQEPRLDITEIDPQIEDLYDFIISTDVFEHVAPPVSIAFRNAYQLLKPGGVFIFTAPYKKIGLTEEFFPNLYDYTVGHSDDGYVLNNTTKDGCEEVFTDLTFHGGPGVTLAMRMFSELSLLEEFSAAGFHQIRIANESCFEHGIHWNRNSALPIVARK